MGERAESVWYVYGVVAAKPASPGQVPAGLDDAPVTTEPNREVAALVSVLPGNVYGPTSIEAHTANVDWVGPRAIAHDRVLTWASDRSDGVVVPFPMFSMFSGRDAVKSMLDQRAAELQRALDRARRGREYALRVYRLDTEMLDAVSSLSPRLRELSEAAEQAKPGQRYLLTKKLEGETKTEMRRVSADMVDEIVKGLGAHAVAVERSPIPKDAGSREASRGQMVLNASFLVASEAFKAFQVAMSDLVHRHTTHGLRFDFTGPWPPYHFVQAGQEGGASRG